MKVENIIISKQGKECENYNEIIKISKEKNINIIIVKAGQKINVDKYVCLNILFPGNNLINENVLNNNSVIAKLEYGKFSMLFTGDIEKVAENKLIEMYTQKNKNLLKSTILKVPHHGSKSSSTENFLKYVNPEIALIGVGENNLFGHPNEEVLNRLKSCGCKIYRTDLDGEITLKINKSNHAIYVKTK